MNFYKKDRSKEAVFFMPVDDSIFTRIRADQVRLMSTSSPPFLYLSFALHIGFPVVPPVISTGKVKYYQFARL